MSRENLISIEHLEVRKSAIEKVKKFFKIDDDSEAVKMAVDVASGKIELESVFEKHKGIKIKKIYN
ncbi:MAG: hypothetical protein HY266_07550 [Deltaproteobacteria bacterium]|nr:hypothetical protein [Deltaproteobacteria bacterium]